MNSQPAGDAHSTGHPHPAAAAAPRLNLFAFPSLTTLLFALIASVILVAVGASLAQNPSVLGLMVVLGMVVLPVRSFWRQVDRDLCHLGLATQNNDPPEPALLSEIREAAGALGMRRPPRLLIAPGSLMPATVGSWRRRYIALGRSQVDCLAELPPPVQKALWFHEVAHFANGDHWKVSMARSLLRTTVGFMSWSALFLLGIVIMALVYGFELFEPGYLETLPVDPAMRQLLEPLWPDPALMAPLLDKARTIQPGLACLYVLNAFLPFVFSALVLLPLVWRRLVQVREFYADARVARQVGASETARTRLSEVATALALGREQRSRSFGSLVTDLRGRLNHLLTYHPSWQARFKCLDRPVQVFGSRTWAGLIAGLTVLLLDLILVGPFTLGYLSGGPAHFVTLSGYVILGVWLVPVVCQGFSSTASMLRQVAGAVLILVSLRAGWLLLNTGLLLALLILDPGLLHTALNATVFLSGKVLTGSAALPLPQEPAALAAWAIGGAWGLSLLAGACILAFLFLAGLLLRRLLTWYAFPNAGRRLLRASWAMILVLALVLGAVVLPPPTALIQGKLGSFLEPLPLLSLAIAGLCALAGSLWFLHNDRRYSRRCPKCGGQVPGWFELGKRCPGCGHVLHTWLLAGY